MNFSRLSPAIKDLRYLLNRGYPRASAVDFVSNHFRLTSEERHLLVRCIFSDEEARRHRRKTVKLKELRGKRLGIDGYNVLITLESLMLGKLVVRCDDGFLRDLRGVFGKYRMSEHTNRTIKALAEILKRAKPRAVAVFFDKQVSRSGELAATVRREFQRSDIAGYANAVAGVDKELRAFEVVASSDRVIIERASKVWDIPKEFSRLRRVKTLDLSALA
jgi:hypothetical protein